MKSNSTEINLLNKWINPRYLKEMFTKDSHHAFISNKPFPHLVLPQFFLPEKITALEKALSKEDFHLKDADLFTFFQTNDLVGTKNKILQDFRTFLSSSAFVSLMSAITGIKLVPQKIDLAGSLYTSTHHLLPHDDHLEQREVAFMLYLTTLHKKDGGALGLYASQKGVATKIVKRILPEKNTFVFFTVTRKSFHEVEEVLTDTKRVALSGWFYTKMR